MDNRTLLIEFYKGNLEFPISGGDTMSATYKPTILRVLKVLKPFIGKKTNVRIDEKAKEKFFIKDLIYFCKLEGIDYKQILELDVRSVQDELRFHIIVNYGSNSDVRTLTI